ncbi:TPA: hypothetical protein ACSEXO_003548 [Proteus mirabilis]|uniref:Immunity protein 43 domain-containing protein n=2 Tax=Gammaproteobacteria TaxID=1236 RepID=A0A379FG85_PROMI|nr:MULTISPECIES: hypothetical protein [Bacteria]EEI47597.1 hypothetical protein HMPREF0693_2462 [Proteus mirabilis ATCC 29906]EKT8412904.1 hypothetical protein [Proteus mirabilis]EKU7617598.1 hypothetical protein [Proteus mirabilis]ELA9903904.1 hypothetical protein [Proteus mirabilis]ELI0196049.1 hypothetical protein [Proteus mirabilis]
MINNVYYLKSDMVNYCSFIQNYPDGEESIMGRSRDQGWRRFGNDYTEISLELRSNDFGKKNYQFDFSSALSPFFVFSESGANHLFDILNPRGQFLGVRTASKRKKFIGYYPTNVLSECVDKEKSIYTEYPKGFMFEKLILVKNNITDEYLFSINENISGVFVTDKFRKLVEKIGLLGFDFSKEIELS